ncbi:MAG: hypothetical protein M3P43_02485 [Actinomycetota bacterium]|nr:hypothetical protein [Actinomycetota bacterium]
MLGSWEFEISGVVDDKGSVGAMAVHAFSLAMIAAADVLCWESRDELVEYRDRVIGLSGDLFAEIAGELGAMDLGRG